jgi:hypothetical protein
MESLKSVVTSRIAGNDENIRGLSMYRDVKRTIRESVMFIAMQTSSSAVGSGKMRIARIPTRATGMKRLLSPPRLNPVLAAAVAIA